LKSHFSNKISTTKYRSSGGNFHLQISRTPGDNLDAMAAREESGNILRAILTSLSYTRTATNF
jgi:hypothetical protein